MSDGAPAVLHALWPSRWPSIALPVCVDAVNAAEPDDRPKVRWELPCSDCPEQVRCLNAKRKELGPLLYDREELTRPRSSESSLFPLELFEPDFMPGLELVRYYTKPFGDEHRYGVATAWDLAWSEKAGGDYLAKMTGVIDRQTGKKRLLDVDRWQQVTFDEQIDLITASYMMFRDDAVVIEADAAQRVWYQHLNTHGTVPVIAHTAQGKKDFATGVPGLLIALENHRWEWPYSPGSYHFDVLMEFFAEAEAFGWANDKLEGVGEHDDLVMAWWHLDWALTAQGIPVERREVRRGVQPGKYI